MDDLIYKINDYSDIFIKKNSLVVLDIDDTVLTYKGVSDNFYQERFNHYHKIYSNYDMILRLIKNDWNYFVKINPPNLINKKSFFNFIDIALKSKCEIIFLTSRPKTMKLITRYHFECNRLNDFIDKIHYSSSKGTYLKKLKEEKFKNYHNIIFVDDLKENLINVFYHLQNLKVNIDLYQFNL